MLGLLNLEDFGAGEADLVKSISKLGYNDTPLFNSIMKSVPNKTAESWKGHGWRYEESPDGDDTNAYVEGSAPANAVSRDLGDSLNHYQIIKHTYGVTGSMEGKSATDGSNELANEGASSVIRHRKTIEKALFSNQAPVQGLKDTSVAGKMGGLHHWCSVENTIDTAGDMSMSLLRELFKISFLNGQQVSHLYVSDIQKDTIDDLMEAKVNVGLGASILEGTNYMQIKNMAYAPNVKIVMSPYVAADEVISVNHADIALVYQRLTKSYELSRTKDAIEKELISEMTLRINNPFAIAKISGLSV